MNNEAEFDRMKEQKREIEQRGQDEFRQQRDDLSAEMERCHRLLDVYYGESLETTALDTLEDRLKQLLDEIKQPAPASS
jgi:hypothetical protein